MKEDAILKIFVTDVLGSFRELITPINQLDDLLHKGIAFDGSSVNGVNSIHTSDATMFGVAESLIECDPRIANSDKKEYWIIAKILDADGNPHPNCVRGKLSTLQDKLSTIWDGGVMNMGNEPEAYFIHDPSSIGLAGGTNDNYFNPEDVHTELIVEIQDILISMGFEIERSHTEVGEDQFEINWKFDRAEQAADRIQFYKLICKKVAANYDVDVTFLPKPFPDRNGSGMHCHLSIWNQSGNLMYNADARDNYFFSDTGMKFLAGILENAKAVAAISNPAVCSYARLVPGFEAPTIIAVGVHNRSAGIRVPSIPDESKVAKQLRFECRFPDPLANPYLLAAALLAAGIDGIQSDYSFPGFVSENLYALSEDELKQKGLQTLPRNLWESYDAFVADDHLKELLGEPLFASYKLLLEEELHGTQAYANMQSMHKFY